MLSRCSGCGREYDLSAYPPGYTGVCLCGATVSRADASSSAVGGGPTAAAGAAMQQVRVSGLAVAALVLGIVSVPLFVLWIPLGPIGLGLGTAGLISTSRRPDRSGAGLAIGGLVLSGLSLVIYVFFIIGAIGAAMTLDNQMETLGGPMGIYEEAPEEPLEGEPLDSFEAPPVPAFETDPQMQEALRRLQEQLEQPNGAESPQFNLLRAEP